MPWRAKISTYLGADRARTTLPAVSQTENDFDALVALLTSQSESWQIVFWIELPLRNKIHQGLTRHFGNQWWANDDFKRLVGPRLAAEAMQSKWARDPQRAFLDDLSMGFWVRCLSPSLEKRLWIPILSQSFTPGVSRKKLHNQLLAFKKYRKAIAHHEHRSGQQLEHMKQLALEIAACIDSDLPELLKYVLSRAT